MLESIKKTMLSALRALPLTADEVVAVIDGLQEKGDISEEQARKLRAALLGKPGKEGDEARRGLEQELERLAGLLPVVSRREFGELSERVRRIEEKMGLGTAPPPPEPAPDEVQPPAGEAGG